MSDQYPRDPLVERDGFAWFVYRDTTEEDQKQTSMTVTVYSVNSWFGETREPAECEEYLTVTVKWDGCSHLNFGDAGYLHLCGGSAWRDHAKVMEAIWNLAKTRITGFDREVAEE